MLLSRSQSSLQHSSEPGHAIKIQERVQPRGGGGALKGSLSGGVPPRSSNPDPV